jgi:hypothetical protein
MVKVKKEWSDEGSNGWQKEKEMKNLFCKQCNKQLLIWKFKR